MPAPVRHIALAAFLAATLAASSASATAEPRARLIECETGSCLVVTGTRTDPASTVRINGRAVSVEGSRRWRTSLRLETVRAWSAPRARTITVSVVDSRSLSEASAEADLPIGLLGHDKDLAMLVVRIK